MAKHFVQMAPEMQETGALAAALWHARRDRRSHPEGTFDNASRFYPSDDEDCDGYTRFVRTPSRSWPNSYNVAARSRAHCLTLTLRNRPFVERLVAAGDLFAGIDERQRRLGAGWVLKAAREAHDDEVCRVAEAEHAAKVEAARLARAEADRLAEEARPDEDDIAALLAA